MIVDFAQDYSIFILAGQFWLQPKKTSEKYLYTVCVISIRPFLLWISENSYQLQSFWSSSSLCLLVLRESQQQHQNSSCEALKIFFCAIIKREFFFWYPRHVKLSYVIKIFYSIYHTQHERSSSSSINISMKKEKKYEIINETELDVVGNLNKTLGRRLLSYISREIWWSTSSSRWVEYGKLRDADIEVKWSKVTKGFIIDYCTITQFFSVFDFSMRFSVTWNTKHKQKNEQWWWIHFDSMPYRITNSSRSMIIHLMISFWLKIIHKFSSMTTEDSPLSISMGKCNWPNIVLRHWYQLKQH